MIQRYRHDVPVHGNSKMSGCDDGPYVKFEDCVKLQSERDGLEKALDELSDVTHAFTYRDTDGRFKDGLKPGGVRTYTIEIELNPNYPDFCPALLEYLTTRKDKETPKS